jgi:DNA-binding PadR family transcriptional regulator
MKSSTWTLISTHTEKLGDFEFLLVSLIQTIEVSRAYGAELHRALSAQLGREVAIAQVFNTLDRLREKGVLESDHVAPPPGTRGPVRNVYRLTPLGLAALASARAKEAVRSRKVRGQSARPLVTRRKPAMQT